MINNQEHFSPEDIKITNAFISLGSLDEKIRLNKIEVYDSNKLGYPWSFQKMSRLIESILLRIPLPIFYFDVSNPYQWGSINGREKLRTIEMFMNNDLKLEYMEILTELNGITYDSLDNYYKRILYDTQIITYQIEAQTPPKLRELIYHKIKDMNEN